MIDKRVCSNCISFIRRQQKHQRNYQQQIDEEHQQRPHDIQSQFNYQHSPQTPAEIDREQQLQSLLLLQQQVAAATKEHLEGTFEVGAPLRRCSSLSQGHCFAEDLQNTPPPPQKINGTSPLTSSPWLSSTNNSNNSSRYLYRGKFQPVLSTSTNSMNTSSTNSMNNNTNSNGNNNKNSPWQLRSNLSSFARRRRGSSTSLHTFSDNDDDSAEISDVIFNGSKKKSPQPDSVSLAGPETSVNNQHR